MSVERWNLLLNPSWDSGTLDGWQMYNQSGIVSTSFSYFVPGPRWGYLAQNYSLEVSLGAGASVSIGNLNFVPVSLEDDYQVILYVSGGAGTVIVRLMVKYYTAGFIHLETQYNEYTGPWVGWTILRGVSVPPPTAAYARFAIQLNNTGTTTSYIRLDEAAMYQVRIPLLRGFKTWSNVSGSQAITVSKNMIRVYQLTLHNRGTTATHVYIEPYPDVPAGILYGGAVDGNSTVTFIANPPVHNIDRPYPGTPWQITNRVATGGLLVAVYYINTMDYWTTSDL